MEKLFTIKEIADRYMVTENAVRSWIKSGKLNAMKVGTRYLTKECEVIKFEKKMEVK